MAQRTSNPTVLSPTSRFAIPQYRSYSRSPSLSPSRSPYRRQQFTTRELDPLLSNLSPTSTLEALTATQAISFDGERQQTALTTSIADASESERTLGIRAALAGKKLREWYQEVRGWAWPTGGPSKVNGFEMPSVEQRARNARKYDHEGNINQALSDHTGSAATAGAEGDKYYGSIPALVVEHYEKRIGEIILDMETLEVEELQEHVREAHSSLRSRPTSSDGSPSSHSSLADYNHLDDFTAVVTTTILQAIPYISRLDALLNVWFIRLSVLRRVPKFLQRLDKAQIAMESAWRAIGNGSSSTPVKTLSDISRDAFSEMRSILEDKISELGHSIDGMLDALEGRDDTVPNQWIDRMEGIEADFLSWVAEAEKQVMQNELRGQKEKEQSFMSQDMHTIQGESQQKDMNSNLQRLGQQSPLTRESKPTESHGRGRTLVAGSSSLPSISRIPSQAASEVSEGHGFQHPPLHSLILSPDLAQPSPPRSPVYAETDMREFLYAHVNALSQTADEGNDPEHEYRTYSGPYNAKLQGEHKWPENTSTSPLAAVDTALRASLQHPSNQQLPPLQSYHSRNQSEVSTDTSHPGSATSESFSNMSSPEIQDAVMVEYFSKPTEVSTQSPVHSPFDSMSRASSRTERGSVSTIRNVERLGTTDQTSPYSRSRTSSVAPEATIPEYISSSLEAAFGHGIGEVSPTQKAEPHYLQPEESPDVLGVGQSSESFTFKDNLEQSPSVRAFNKRQSVAAANSALLTSLSKSRSRFDDHPDLRAEHSSNMSPQQKTTKARPYEDTSPAEPKEAPIPSRSTEAQLEARISSILTDIPMRIQLTSEPKIDTPETVPPRTSSASKGLGIVSPAMRVNRVQTASPAVTLAPAFPRSANSRQSLRGDPEIKLYHLHQPGKEAPIKLFVRLVGDARERVMVRVGGGWADLGEYLKEYAIHHGRRSVADGRFEIQGLPSSRTTSPVTVVYGNGRTTPGNGRSTPGNGRTTPGNGRTTPGNGRMTPGNGRNTPGNGRTTPRNGRTTPPSRPESPPFQHPGSLPTNPHHSFTPSAPSLPLPIPLPLTPDIPVRLSSNKKFKHTPSHSIESIGYPSVGLHSRYPFPNNISGGGGDTPPLGLAGPKSRDLDLSPRKQAWVDGMMERARASGGEGKGREKADGQEREDWGELGRVGGTKRVVLMRGGREV